MNRPAGQGGATKVQPASPEAIISLSQVDNALAMHEMLLSNSVDIVSAPKTRPDGPTQVFIKDPDGHLIEFFSLPDRSNC